LDQKTTNKKKVIEAIFSKIVASNHELFEFDLDTKIWTSGSQRFAQIPEWHKRGLARPINKTGLNTTKDRAFRKLAPFKKDKLGKLKPFKDLVIYPSIDPYDPDVRAMSRLLMQENPIILQSSEILQQLVVTDSTRIIEPRDEIELPEDDTLDKWKNTPIYVPYWDRKETPTEILKWIDGYAKSLDFDSLLFDAYLFMREQGRTCIGMFPLDRRSNGKLKLPQALKLIRPELLRRPIVNLDTGEMAGVEVSNLTTNGSILDSRRCVYFNFSKNLELYGDFYGRIPIRSLIDAGKVILLILGRDWNEAVLQTWHTKPIFKHNLPSKDWSKVKILFEEFNSLMEQSQNKTVSVTNNVELLNPNGTDSGDITGINEILNEAIKIVTGFDNIPLYMIGHGEAGNLGGNANREEVQAFLKTKVKPQQELMEHVAEDQFYDRILAILFDLEPEDVNELPLKIRHNFEKPNISIPLTQEQWNIFMFLIDNGHTTMEQVMEEFGLRHMMTNSPDLGTDTSPANKTFDPHYRRKHPTWERVNGNLRSRPLKKNFMVHGQESISEIAKQKGELISNINKKLNGERDLAKMTKKLEREFKLKEQQLTAKLNKDKLKFTEDKLKFEQLKKKNTIVQ